jgi:DNA-binding NarL/FixJ family response regulator
MRGGTWRDPASRDLGVTAALPPLPRLTSMALDRLTTTEARVAGLFASGYAHGEITAELEISPQEPESHVAGVFRKFGIHAGLLVTAAGESVLRPTPPLIVGDGEIDQALAILAEVLA